MSSQIDQLASAAVQHNAEDLFLKVNELPHARVGGQVMELGDQRLTFEDLAQLWQACGKDPMSGAMDHDASWANSAGYRFRVNLFRNLGSIGAALRPIKTDIPQLETLGAPVERLQEWSSRSAGLVLVTGGTGSGKSTTLASALQWVNVSHCKHLVTIEDPVEYLISPARSFVTQREVGTDTDSFSSGLRAALRQSPDVILVGEIRDSDTARIALQAGETGHLVFATMHSSDVAETMERLVALFPPSERESALIVLSKQLIGILCQQLVSSADGNLHLLTEHLENTGAVRKWLHDGETSKIQEFLERDAGDNVRFIDSIVAAAQSGKITDDVARAACADPHEFDRRRSGISSGTR